MTDPQRTMRELFDLLHRAGWIPEGLVTPLRNTASFRNDLVHGYDDVDLAIVRDVWDHHPGELLAFVEVTRSRLREA